MRNRQIELVRGLRNNKLKQAMDNYCNGILLARIIGGECLNADAINEFRKLHVLPFHTKKRDGSKIMACDKSCVDEIMQPTVEYPQIFEDEPSISPAKTTISAVNYRDDLHGSAARMCAEA